MCPHSTKIIARGTFLARKGAGKVHGSSEGCGIQPCPPAGLKPSHFYHSSMLLPHSGSWVRDSPPLHASSSQCFQRDASSAGSFYPSFRKLPFL